LGALSEVRQRKAIGLTLVIQTVPQMIQRSARISIGGTTQVENAEPAGAQVQFQSSDMMDQSKIENFARTYQESSFPNFRTLSSAECAEVRGEVVALLQLGPHASGLDIVKTLHRCKAKHLGEVGIDRAVVHLREVLHEIPLSAHHQIFVNWYQFDQIDGMDLDDLSSNFDDIWYPSVDDIEIFDKSLTWFLSVSHDGRLTLLEPTARAPISLKPRNS
jgi:hypothetical protein